MPDDRISNEVSLAENLTAPKEVQDDFVRASERIDAMVQKLEDGEVVKERFDPYRMNAEFRKLPTSPVPVGYRVPPTMLEVKLHVEGAPQHHGLKRSKRPLFMPIPCGNLHIYKNDTDDAYYIQIEQLKDFIKGLEYVASSSQVRAVHSTKANAISR